MAATKIRRPANPDLNLLRTTTFRLDRDHCGQVWRWRAGPRARALWQNAAYRWSSRAGRGYGSWGLPHKSLAIALTVMSKDLVCVEPRLNTPGDVLLISRAAIPPSMLVNALMAWEREALQDVCGLDALVDDLHPEQVALWDLWPQTPGAPSAPGWWYECAKWEIGHRLCKHPLRADGRDIPLHLDSQGSLLTWDSLIYGKEREPSSGSSGNWEREPPDSAMHRIILNPITIPGWREPFISLVPTVSRLTYRLGKWVRNVWVEVGAGQPVLRAHIQNVKGENGFYSDWKDAVGRVLNEAAPVDLPTLDEATLRAGHRLRATSTSFPFGCSIGRGPGQKLFDAVAHHAHALLPELEPVLMHTSTPVKKRPESVSSAVGMGEALRHQDRPVRIVCLYDHVYTRRRMAVGLAQVLESTFTARLALAQALEALSDRDPGGPQGEDGAPDLTCFRHRSGIEILFRKPYRSDMLCSFGEKGEIRERAEEWIQSEVASGCHVLSLVETLSDRALKLAEKENSARKWKRQPLLADPKFIVRQTLASRGIITQFMAESSLRDGSPSYSVETLLKRVAKEQKTVALADSGGQLADSDGQILASPSRPSNFQSSTSKRMKPRPTREESEQSALALSAYQATLDLLRGGGIFPWQMEGSKLGVPRGTWLVGITGVCRQKPDRKPGELGNGWALTLVATQVGARTAKTWLPKHGWLPFAEGNAIFQTDIDLFGQQGACDALEEALRQFLAGSHGPVVLFVDAQACRRLWNGLQEQHRDVPLPEVVQLERVAVVRCRGGRKELPSLAGGGEWNHSDARTTRYSLTRLLASERSGACRTWYYGEAPPTQQQPGKHREWTRFGLPDPEDQRDDWHSFVTREFLVAKEGPFKPLQLALLAAHQCRCAPTWDGGTLARPAPLHLAQKMLQDHPCEPLDEAEVEEEEEG